jgi:hypothetical protein
MVVAMYMLKDLLAILMIGDGLSAAVVPRRRMQRWAWGPFRRPAEAMDERPALTRLVGFAAVALGLWWTARLPDRPGV